MTEQRIGLVLLGLLFFAGVRCCHGQAQGPLDAHALPSCTDLSGESVPCPSADNASQNPSAQASQPGITAVCTDVSGDRVPCPGESRGSSEKLPAANLQMSVGLVKAGASDESTPSQLGEDIDAPCRDASYIPVTCPEAAVTRDSVSTVSVPASETYSLERSLPRNLYVGQKNFWTMPSRWRLRDFYWGIPFGLTTAALIASDTSIKKALPQSPGTVKQFDNLSNYGAVAFGALVGGGYVLGRSSHNTYLSDTAWLAGEAGLNGFATTYGLKYLLGRQRPDEGNRHGDFFSGGQSFPSEHAAAAWSIATVLADRYPSNWTKLFLYGGASTISVSRMIAQKHFASDVFVGSALGWYFGEQALKSYERAHEDDSVYGRFIPESNERPNIYGHSSTYIELDNWMYPAVERLAATSAVSTAFLGLRPWTRAAVRQMLDAVDETRLSDFDATLVRELLADLKDEEQFGSDPDFRQAGIDRVYARTQYISGMPLNDSYHFGQTVINDFGRPFGEGLQQIVGEESRAELGGFSLFVRGEYQHTPSIPGYSDDVEKIIANQDSNPVHHFDGLSSSDSFRFLDTYASINLLGNEFSFGKQSYWWGPGTGSALFLSDNAEPFYGLRITRTTPLYLPWISKILGPMRYDNFFGKLSGHMYPRQPWFYGQEISFRPTINFEFGAGRDAVFAGDDVEALTYGNFFHSFFSTTSGTCATCPINQTPGARHANFYLNYRLPRLRNWVTFYADSLIHDGISPIESPRRSAIYSGIYLARFPFLSKLDLHVEGGTTDTTPARAKGGQFYYWESIYRDAYTNKGNILGSWVGREGTGGSAWATYWLTPRSTVQFGYRYLKTSQFFVPQGETQHDGYGQLKYEFNNGLGLTVFMQGEHWTAPALATRPQTNVTTSIELSFSPKNWKISRNRAEQ